MWVFNEDVRILQMYKHTSLTLTFIAFLHATMWMFFMSFIKSNSFNFYTCWFLAAHFPVNSYLCILKKPAAMIFWENIMKLWSNFCKGFLKANQKEARKKRKT